jgi:drug/metabolite transporter (DMT)-like permease
MNKPNLLKGSLLVIAAFFGMAIFGVLTKIASEKGAEIWVSFLTYLMGTLLLLPFVLWKGIGFLKTEHFGYHFGRSAFGLTASFVYMISMHYIPIVNATLLFNTTPIFIPILAALWLKQDIAAKIWCAVALGFLGIIIIIKPNTAIFTQPGNLLGLASGFSLAIAYLLIKILTPTDHWLRIIFYYFFISTCLQLPLLFFAGPLPELNSILISLLAGFCLVLAQIFLVLGYEYADASTLGVYQYTSVIYVGIIEWLVWGIIPPVSDLLGVLLVMLAGFIIIRKGHMTHLMQKDTKT